MKLIAAIVSAVIIIAIATTGYAQSLADIADKEKQRREEIKEAPSVITNDKVSEYSGGSVSTIKLVKPPSSATDSEKAEGAEESAEASEAGETEKEIDPNEPVDFEGRPESYWRETMSAAREKVKSLEEEAKALTSRMNNLETDFNNNDDGFSRDSTQKEIQKTYYEQDMNAENLAKAKKELEDLEKEARKSGALPGWLD